MTVPQDGQPLTRRQLRDLERSPQQAAEISAAPAAEAVPVEAVPAPAPTYEAPAPSQPASEPQTRRARYHSGGGLAPVLDGSTHDEELVVVARATDGSLSDEEAELAEVEDAPVYSIPTVTIDEGPSDPVLAPAFQAAPVRSQYSGTHSFDDLLGPRGVGASNSISATSALVLPSVPGHSDVGSALDETGEVIITGSIDLPASLSATGAHPTAGLERSDLDSLMDGNDREMGSSDVAPMSASRAISTHNVPSAMVTRPRRAKVNAPLVLAIVAGVLAVGVVSLLLAAFVFRVF